MTQTAEARALPHNGWPTLAEIEDRVCPIASEQLQIPRSTVQPASRLIQDLHCESLELLELMMALEEHFGVTLERESNPICKAVFMRQPFRLADLSEAIYVQRGTGTPERNFWRQARTTPSTTAGVPFTQLEGRWQRARDQPLFERIQDESAIARYRRRSDGMRCVAIPSSTVVIGCDRAQGTSDEGPQHSVDLDAFLIDAEPVSTSAYCRFLNSIGEDRQRVLEDWFLLTRSDKRNEHALIEPTDSGWRPIAGTETWPMILVSWYGANAYSLWANGRDWTDYRDDNCGAGSFLPTEAQWEYAARGPGFGEWPWGDDPPSPERMRYGQHSVTREYLASRLPLAGVNDEMGMSPFGLHHMAGNVWQWCRDWYRPGFYSTPDAAASNGADKVPTQVRSERGGSWVGPADLCRSSYRRGRPPEARGRCLGFRCVSDPNDIER